MQEQKLPLYQQIVTYYKQKIISGVRSPHEALPSVRQLAQSLSVNPNTAMRAYRVLEQEGFIYSIRGKGMFVSPPENYRQENVEALKKELEYIVRELLYAGVSADQIDNAVKNLLYGDELR